MEKHQQYLDDLCRVCGKKVGRVRYSVMKYQEVLSSMGLFVAHDIEHIHPKQFCNSCYLTGKRMTDKSTNYSYSRVIPPIWEEHMDDKCNLCNQMVQKGKGGRQKKNHICRGRPTSLVSYVASLSVPGVQSHSLLPSLSSTSSNINITHLICICCKNIVNFPVEITPCRALICKECCIQCIRQYKPTFKCHKCKEGHPNEELTFVVPSPVILNVWESLNYPCQQSCGKLFNTNELDAHYTIQCSESHNTIVSSTSPSSRPTQSEQQVAASVVQRMLSDSNIISLSVPKGKPLSIMKVTSPQVDSSQCTRKTVKRRSQELANIRDAISGGQPMTQLQSEVLMLPTEEKKKLMREVNFTINIPPECGLAMKADLSIPWNKLRVLRRWLKLSGVNIASENKQRCLAKKQLEATNVMAEAAPFSFPLKRGGEEMRPAALAYVNNLTSLVYHLLDENDRLGQLTWHNDLIPYNEVWIKIGGDKGGTSFKASFQLVNTNRPNSVTNTCVFTVFEAGDSVTNLHIALSRYSSEIETLSLSKWRDKQIRIFISGDYEYLCRTYGISGASGRHCCLWCVIKSGDMLKPKSIRSVVQQRTLENMALDFQRFQGSGGDIKKAKDFNNVINTPIFEVPISQVSPPGLHISLGIFQRLFTLLEDSCHELDIKLSESTTTSTDSTTSFDDLIQARKDMKNLVSEYSQLESLVRQHQQLLTYLLLTQQNPQQSTVIQQIAISINSNSKRLDEIYSLVEKNKKIVEKGFEREEGRFVKGLDTALSTFQVQRQAYYGGTFVGNHVHRCLKENNILTLCNSVVETATRNDITLVDEAEQIRDKYHKLFKLFADCHNIYNSTFLIDSEINDLESNICKFLDYYRSKFPTASITPKLHMLEDHIIPWIRQWHVGFGLMGEQGAESIHAAFNYDERIYANLANRVERLKSVLQNHHLKITPSNVVLQPPSKKYTKKSKD